MPTVPTWPHPSLRTNRLTSSANKSPCAQPTTPALYAGHTADDVLVMTLPLCICDVCVQLFKNWPVTPLGPWPSPKPYPSTIPEADGIVSELEGASDDNMDIKLRLRKFTTLMAFLSESSEESESTGSSSVNGGGFYGLAKSVLKMALTGAMTEANPKLGDPCGWNVTCIIHRVFDNHLPLNGELQRAVRAPVVWLLNSAGCCFRFQTMMVIMLRALVLTSSPRASVERIGEAATGVCVLLHSVLRCG